jgi:outer membrane protein OmpA-like peptidoglycan-associated protein
MRKNFSILNMLILTAMLFAASAQAQTAKDNIFGDVEKAIEEARAQGAEFLAPESFKKAVESFKEANEFYKNNESTRDIREKLTDAQMHCNRAMEIVKLGKISLKDATQAHYDAMKANADQYATELFKEGQEIFKDATGELEDGDIESARDKGSEAEALFRKAELKAIKAEILGESRRLIEEAREKECPEIAPNTFNYAQSLLNEVEDLLTNNRYAAEEASAKAEVCEYQARHAMYLTNEIKTLKEDERNWEKILLEAEDILTGFAGQFNETPRYEHGMSEAVELIQTRINEMQTENDELSAKVKNLQEKYEVVREEAVLSSTELAKKQEMEANIAKIKAKFNPNEAKVVFDGDNLILHVYGINFPSGRAIIQPEYFSLLTKVQESIKIFPDRHVLIEGHTDSQGNASTNKSLSEERANAVREYIIANMNINREQITSVGYGSAQPIASNKTAEGRAQNRRIDVVINLSN